MQRILLLSLGLVLSASAALAQDGYLEEFDGDLAVQGTDNISVAQSDGVFSFTGNGATGGDEGVLYTITADGGSFDISSNNTVYIRARANSAGTILGVELIDSDGNQTAIDGDSETLAPALTTSFRDYTLDFTGNLGSVNASSIAQIKFIGQPFFGEFDGTISIDALGLVEELEAVAGADYQDNFDNDSSVTAFTVYTVDGAEPFVNETVAASGEAVIRGTGAKGGYVDFRYSPRNQVDFSPVSLGLPASDGKLYIKAKSTVPETSLRIDAIDSRGFMTAGVGITKQLGTEYEIFEYDYTNGYFADRWTPPCDEATAPCPVDGSEIVSFRIIPEPGQEVFAGTITFEWLSIGESLEPVEEKPLLYTDCFEDGLNNFVSEGNGFFPVETDGQLEVTVTAEKERYSTFTYNINDRLTQENSSVDITEASTLNVTMRVDGPDALIRIDAVNSANFASTQSSLRSPVTNEFQTYTFDFAGAKDGGYGGSACEEGTGPCDVALDSIVALYFYINDDSETNFGYEGTLIIDDISFGRKIEEGDCNEFPPGNEPGQDGYNDELNDNETEFLVSFDGAYTVGATDSTYQIVGDGTAPGYQRVRYRFNDGSDTVLVNVANNNEVRIRARVLDVADARVRVDLIDNADFSTTNAGRVLNLTNEFQEFTIDFSGAYQDGGYGGTACPVTNGAEPCSVDGQRASGLYFYPAVTDGSGASQGFQNFNGIIEIDAIGAGQVVSVNAARELADVRVMPNPVNDLLTVTYDLEVAGDVSVALYDGIGRQVLRQSQGSVPAGAYSNSFETGQLSAGIYQVVLSVDGYVGKTVSVVKQ